MFETLAACGPRLSVVNDLRTIIIEQKQNNYNAALQQYPTLLDHYTELSLKHQTVIYVELSGECAHHTLVSFPDRIFRARRKNVSGQLGLVNCLFHLRSSAPECWRMHCTI